MRRLIAMTAAIVLVVAACGGDSGDGADESGNQPATTQAATTQAAPEDGGVEETTAATSDGDDDGSGGGEAEGSGPSTATVTLGNDTYNFSTEGAVVAQCLADFFGVFSVQLPMADGGDGNVSIAALHEGTDPDVVGQVNAIEVGVGDEDWVADEASFLFDQSDQLDPGMSQVDSLEIEGRTVRGMATFVRQNSVLTGEVETITGTFEATCGEERTS